MNIKEAQKIAQDIYTNKLTPPNKNYFISSHISSHISSYICKIIISEHMYLNILYNLDFLNFFHNLLISFKNLFIISIILLFKNLFLTLILKGLNSFIKLSMKKGNVAYFIKNNLNI